MLEGLAQLVGALILIGIIWAIISQMVGREHIPLASDKWDMSLEEWDMSLEEWDMIPDFEPDNRTLQERIDEQRRLLRFQGFDVDKTG